jgi:hypothetical protein
LILAAVKLSQADHLVILPQFEPSAHVAQRGALADTFDAGGSDVLYTHHVNCCTGCGGLALRLN